MKHLTSFYRMMMTAVVFFLAAVLIPASLLAQDPWANAAADLPDTLSWIQRTTVTAADGSSYYRDATFYDGLGYPLQEVLVGASPGGLKSIYTPVVYDSMRRADYRAYLPFAMTTPAVVYDSGALDHLNDFYKPDPEQDERPYSEKVYETSPVGRPVSIQREGLAWNTGGGHRTVLSYRTNTAADAVPRYRILPPASAGQTATATFLGFWPEGSLLCTEAVDEESDTVRTWTDAFDKMILTEAGTGKNPSRRRSGEGEDPFHL